MLPLRDQPFPSAVVADLVAIARSLHRRWSAETPGAPRLVELERIGRELREALDLGRRSEPGTMGHAGALSRAGRLAVELGKLVGEERVEALVAAAGEAVRRTR